MVIWLILYWKKDELKEICYNDDDLDDFMLKEYELRRRD